MKTLSCGEKNGFPIKNLYFKLSWLYILQGLKANELLTLNRDVPLTSQLGCDLPTQDRRYLAVGHTTSGGWWE